MPELNPNKDESYRSRFTRWWNGDLNESDARFALGDAKFEQLRQETIDREMPRIVLALTASAGAGFAGGYYYSRKYK